MTTESVPPQPRQAIVSTVLAASGLLVLMAGLVAGIVLSTDALDVREASRTSAWLFPALILGIGAVLTGVILRFSAILDSLRLRIAAMRDHLPALIDTQGGK